MKIHVIWNKVTILTILKNLIMIIKYSYQCPFGAIKYKQQCTLLSTIADLFTRDSSFKYSSNFDSIYELIGLQLLKKGMYKMLTYVSLNMLSRSSSVTFK